MAVTILGDESRSATVTVDEKSTPWRLLIVDETESFHRFIQLALTDYALDGRSVEIKHSVSTDQAREALEREGDFHCLMLNVTMETYHAGVQLIDFLRSDLENAKTRAILVSGHSSMISCHNTLFRYDISAHLRKSLIDDELLQSSVFSALRAYQKIEEHDRDLRDLKTAQEQSHRLACYNTVSSLPNHESLLKHAEELCEMVDACKEVGSLSLILINLNRFRDVNNVFGYRIGNEILRDIGGRLIANLYGVELVAHVGGDQYAVLSNANPVSGKTDDLIDKISMLIAAPVSCKGTNISVSSTIGVARYPDDAESVPDLLIAAQQALGKAKISDGINHLTYDQELANAITKRSHIAFALQNVIEKQEFCLHYQPQYRLSDGALTGVEALIRWQRDDGRFVSPAEFIPIAERTGQILEIGQWVFLEAFAFHKRCQRADMPVFRLAVNVSAKQLNAPNFVENLSLALLQTGIGAEQIELEITESSLVSDLDHTVEILHQLRDRGFQIAIDDFGTGQSSLSYLHKFPIDRLKIDRSFLAPILKESDESPIAKLLVNLSKDLGIEVIAEGVETPIQKAYLTDIGCDEVQGYHLDHPMTEEDFIRKFSVHSIISSKLQLPFTATNTISLAPPIPIV
ncbi:putative bifunctional diguanylate cyclase/phosphodiesterase [Aestuariispira insulae]|uniref:Diguanylate cyclase (GGDEF)-like protein n=1 Tax=Aestuariispira insulae TaxID=1461337 RepID=A0A3D9H1I4_9PROT|nr:GGDEF and EAL domain-containing protein [Aestuariispira insulae]RED43355.1 diguanylate cyclase (GGDEF)-like protein [Aestuariispira insulae]